jgi:hypothetical protein
MLFVVFTFSKHHVETFLELIKRLPKIGDALHALLQEFLKEQQAKLHRGKLPEQVSKQF